MNIEKFNPWNWFKHEELGSSGGQPVPFIRTHAKNLPKNGTESLINLHREMDNWFDDVFKSFSMPSFPSSIDSADFAGSNQPIFYRPKIDISGDDDHYEISLDVPGMSESNLSLEVKNNVLIIKGEKEERNEDKDKDKQYYRTERSYGSFQRTLSLPDDANSDDIKADLDQGVLQLTIPRQAIAEQDVKHIPISS